VIDRPARRIAGIVPATGEMPIFGTGDRVGVMIREPVGHFRVPAHLGGKVGVVEAVTGPAAIDNEEEVVEAFGANMGGKLTYDERRIAAFAKILFQKGILTPSELARKMDEVAVRWERDNSEPAS
jgi:hypothetical protein